MSTLSLRRADRDDARRLFDWQSHPETRRHARNPRPPSWPEHLAWLESCLADPDRILTLIEQDGKPVGMLRLDAVRHDGRRCREVSILVAPDRFGQGIGPAALALAARRWPDLPLLAFVKSANQRSAAAFRKAGFQPAGPEWWLLEPSAPVSPSAPPEEP